MDNELLPCPCCGGEAEFQIFDKICNIECQTCFIGTRFESIDNAELVVETWNKRVKRYPESLAQRMIADGYEYELFTLRKECDKLKADLQAEKESNINTKLTVDQVRKCVLVVYYEGYNDGYLNRGSHYEETDWQAITDELNAARTLAG